MRFAGYDSLSVFDTTEPGLALGEKLAQYPRFIDKDNAYAIYNEYDARLGDDINGTSAIQFLYDIEVFSKIHPEIAPMIDGDGFQRFAGRMFQKCEESGFSVYYTKETKLTRRLNHSGAKALTACDPGDGQDKVIIYDSGRRCLAEEFYEKYKESKHIEVFYPLQLIREWIIELTCRYFKEIYQSRGVSLYLLNWHSAWQTIVPTKGKVTSAAIEERKKYGVRFIGGNEGRYAAFLKAVYEDDYSPAYVSAVFDIPPRIEVYDGYVKHIDRSGAYLTVVDGERLTPDQGDSAGNTIYMLGGCAFFGYAIDDQNTIANQLQVMLNKTYGKGRWNVCNFAVWGGNFDETFGVLYNLRIRKGDIIAVSYAGFMPIGDEDISAGLANLKTDNEYCFDIVLHCNKTGYHAAAEQLISILGNKLGVSVVNDDETILIRDKYSDRIPGKLTQSPDFEDFIGYIKESIPGSRDPDRVCGAIVLNGNPFTLGHKYLVSEARRQADFLILFVVEEDKSTFPFLDRFDLIRKGVAEYENVAVVPGGSFIVSTVTFPGYFHKDNPGAVSIDSSRDARIFAESIAPRFNIKKRFIGEEPFDMVTRKYNENLKYILPRYGVEVIEIPRKSVGGQVISASSVRKMAEADDLDGVAEMVPEATLSYLKNWKATRGIR